MAVNHFYIDYSAGDDTTGDGSIGTPWKTIQKGMDTATEGSDGTQLNLKDNAAHVTAAALDTTTYVANNGALAAAAPLTFRGYTSAADDGGMATITVGGNYRLFAATNYAYINLMDLNIDGHTGALVDTVYLGNICNVHHCKITGVGSFKLRVGSSCNITNCYISGGEFSAADTYAIFAGGSTLIQGCWIAAGSDKGIGISGTTVINNIIVTSGAGIGILNATGDYARVTGNTIFSTTGTGTGISFTAGNYHMVTNNLVAGFSGSGGVGINVPGLSCLAAGNSVYNCATDYALTGLHMFATNNDTAGADPFVDAANGDFDINGTIAHISEDAWPSTWPGLTTNTTPKADKGAVQAGAGAGGGGGGPVIGSRIIRGLGAV